MNLKIAGAAIAIVAPVLSLTACQGAGPLGCSSWKSHLATLNNDAAIMNRSPHYSTAAMRGASMTERAAEDAASCPPPGSSTFDNLWSDTMHDYGNAAAAYLRKDASSYYYYWAKGRAGLHKIYTDKHF